MKIPKEFIDKVKEALPLVDLAGEYTNLRRSGANYMGLCPIHSERSPSFSVSAYKPVYICYGCGASGDTINFLMDMQGLSFNEAVKELAEKAGIPWPKELNSVLGKDESPRRKAYSIAYRMNLFAARWFRSQLGGGQCGEAVEYLKQRGISDEVQKLFFLGVAPNRWDGLAEYLVNCKAPMKYAVKLGLVRDSDKRKRVDVPYFDLFRNRIMFPVMDMKGKVAGFGGRLLPSDTSDNAPKYLNSPQSPLFEKGKILFGLFQAHKHIREKNEVVLVEGHFDVLAMVGAGFSHTVATCGTSLTPEHVSMLKRRCEKIILLFDSDSAGKAAVLRAMEIGLDQGIVLRAAHLEADASGQLAKDPADVLLEKTGASRVQKALEEAQPILDTQIRLHLELARTNEEARSQALKTLSKWLSRFKDPVGVALRRQTIAKGLGVAESVLNEAMKQHASGKGSVQLPSSVPGDWKPRSAQEVSRYRQQSASPYRVTRIEEVMLAGILYWEESRALFDQFRAKLPPGKGLFDLFRGESVREFAQRWTHSEEALQELLEAPEATLEGERDPQVRSIIAKALALGKRSFSDAELEAAIKQALHQSWARFSHEMKQGLASAEAGNDRELLAKLMKEYLDVQRKMKEFDTFYAEK